MNDKNKKNLCKRTEKPISAFVSVIVSYFFINLNSKYIQINTAAAGELIIQQTHRHF